MMKANGDLAISIRGLSKRYTIGRSANVRQTFGEAVMKRLRNPFGHGETSTEFLALNDVSLDVRKGEVIGIIGRNGAGKSTLLKVLSRITEPTKGNIKLYGRVGSLLEVGTGFHPELSGRENIYLNGAILGMRRAEINRHFDAIVDFAEVDKFLDTPVKRYSSGMYVRLAFAVAAHLDPEILVIDEVLAVGDMQFQQKCLGKMSEVARGGRTVLFVSHNMAAVRQLCTSAALLSKGACVAQGSVAHCMDLYLQKHATQESTIVQSAKHFSDHMLLEDVMINGSRSTAIDVAADQRVLNIELSGIIHEPVRFEMELRIFDSNDMPLGFFSPGHESGVCPTWSAGPFKMRRTAMLPRVNRGQYTVQIELTDPGVATQVSLGKSVALQCEGTPTGTGLTFDYARGNGWVLLDGDSNGKAGD